MLKKKRITFILIFLLIIGFNFLIFSNKIDIKNKIRQLRKKEKNELFISVDQPDGTRTISIVGTIQAVSLEDKSITVLNNKKTMSFYVTEETEFVLLEGSKTDNTKDSEVTFEYQSFRLKDALDLLTKDTSISTSNVINDNGKLFVKAVYIFKN